jgi:hypothetical protein
MARNQFWPFEGAASFWRHMLYAVAAGILAVRLGIARGEWLKSIKR